MDSKLLFYAKSPIPVLNNSSPPNYVIMPALLAHYSTEKTPLDFSSSSSTSTPSPQRTHSKTLNNFKNIRICSKEIVYKSKRILQKQLEQQQINTNDSIMGSESSRNENNSTFIDRQPVINSPDSSSSPLAKQFQQTKNLKTSNRYVKSILISNNNNSNDNNKSYNFLSSSDHFDMHDLSPLSSSINEENLLQKNYNIIELIGDSSSSSSPATALHDIGSSFIADTFLNNNLNQQSHGHHQINSNASTDFDEYSNTFSESLQSNNQFQNSSYIDEAKSINTNITENNSSLDGNDQEKNSTLLLSETNTYTISYPTEMQSKVNRMINCFVLLKKLNNDSSEFKSNDIFKEKSRINNFLVNDDFDNTNNDLIQLPSQNEIKLKCGICKTEFNKLTDLLDHKEESIACKYNINLVQSDENFVTLYNMKKAKRRKKELDEKNRIKSSIDSMRKAKKNSNNETKTKHNNLNITNYFLDEDLEFNEQDILNDNQETMFIDEYEISNGSRFKNKNYALLRKQSSKNNSKSSLKNSNSLCESLKYSENGISSNMTEFSMICSDNNDSNCNSNESNMLTYKLIHNKKDIALKGNLEDEDDKNDSFLDDDDDDDDEEKEAYIKPRRTYTKQRVGPITNLTCEKCNKTCRTKAELLVHMHKHTGNEPECWECGKKCASFSNLVSHVQLHTGEKPYTCQFCGKQFTQDAHLTRHIRLHTGERPFVCNLCGKTYKDYSYYKTHLRIHRGERLYKCNYCDKEYYDASYYKKHTRLHTGEKPYMCTVCGKQFHRSDYLKLHSYSHTSERPFNCHLCGKGFKMNYNLKIHLRNHEAANTNNESQLLEEKDEENLNSNNLIENEEHSNYHYEFNDTASKINDEEDNNPINLNLNHPKINSITSIAAVAASASSNDFHDILKLLESV